MALLLCINVFVVIDRHSHSASDTLYGVFPYFASSFLLLNWLASRTGCGTCTTGRQASRDAPDQR
jgi:hypothetical protein